MCSTRNPQILHCQALREMTDASEGSCWSVTSLESLSIFLPPSLLLMGGDDIICSQIRICIFTQAVGGGRRRPCAGNVMLFEETHFLATSTGLFIADLFLAFTKGFHTKEIFLDFFPFFFFFLVGQDGGRAEQSEALATFAVLWSSRLKGK